MAYSRISQSVQSCFDCPSRAGSIFSELDHSRLTELDQMHHRAIYPAGAVVFMEGDQPEGLYLICSGRVKLSSYSSEGRAVIVSIATAGDLLGVSAMLSGKPHDLTAETLEPTQLCSIKKDDFLSFLSRNGDISLRLAQRLSNELYEAYRGLSDVVLKLSYNRLVELLLKLCQSHGETTSIGIRLRIDLSQEDLAEKIGSSRRTLSRTLTKLKRQGIIECQHRSIIVRDIVALENILPPEKLF